MKNHFAFLLLLFLIGCTSMPRETEEPAVTPMMTRSLTDMPGKEGLVLMVEYGPGAADPIHRHDAHAFVYVLEGSIVMQVEGGEEVTLGPGQTFYEGPNDLHVVGRNASSTKPAKFVVFLVKNSDEPALIPEPDHPRPAD